MGTDTLMTATEADGSADPDVDRLLSCLIPFTLGLALPFNARMRDVLWVLLLVYVAWGVQELVLAHSLVVPLVVGLTHGLIAGAVPAVAIGAYRRRSGPA
jgi:uncharacterized membrane protein YjjB (DUF3815 family)